MSIPVTVGTIIPLTLQLLCPDPAIIYYAKVKLLNRDGTLYQEQALTSIGNGIFIDNSVGMPDKDYLTAVYETYLDPGFNTESDYCDATDIFTKADKVIINKVDRTEILLSKVNNTNIEANSKDSEIKVSSKNNVIIAVSDEDAIIDTDGNNADIEV